jgi:aminopeptidase
VVKASAAAGEETQLKLLQTDEGARRLGEVALVPASSPVSRTGLLFYNMLFDENAACHIAIRRSIDACFAGNASLSEDDRNGLGANASIVHVDWMIGSDQIDVDGLQADGSSVAILRHGEWAQSVD